MSIGAKIRAARRCGVVHCGVSARSSPSLGELAAEFGLAPDVDNYTEIDATAARNLTELVLSQDLAYNAEMMPVARAKELAERFLAQFGTEGVQFYTNGTSHEGCGDAGWNPTSATFDTVILVIGPSAAGCLWVEDED